MPELKSVTAYLREEAIAQAARAAAEVAQAEADRARADAQPPTGNAAELVRLSARLAADRAA